MGVVQALHPRSFHRRMLTASATVGALATVVKLAGAAKVIVAARYFGTGDAMDAFLVALILPTFVADVIAGTLTPSMVPVLVSAGGGADEEAATRIVRSAMGIAVAAMIVAAVVLAAGAPVLIGLLASGFSPAKVHLTINLYLLLLPWLPAGACIAGWRALLNSTGHFAVAALAPIGTPVLTIVCLWLFADRLGPYALCFGTLAGVVAECAALAWALRKLGRRAMPVWHGWTPEIAQIWRQYLPFMASVIVSSAGIIVDQAIAATLGGGGVSSLAYGTKVVTVFMAVAATATGTAAIPLFSGLAVERRSRFRRIGASYVAGIFLAGVPVALILMDYSTPIVRIVLQHGAFSAASTEVVSSVQRYALLQVPFGLALALLIRLAAAVQRSSILGRIAVLGFVVNLVCDVLFARWLGVAGLALATAVAQAVSLAALSWALFSRKNGSVA